MVFEFISRRFRDFSLILVGRHYNDYAYELQEALADLWEQVTGGIPGGFNNITPATIQAGVAADAGSESDGWMSASARPSIETGAPSNPTGTAAAEGTGTALMRADATIRQGIVTTKGDVLGYSTVPARVPVGSDGQVLTADSTQALGVKWVAPSGGSATDDDARWLSYAAMMWR